MPKSKRNKTLTLTQEETQRLLSRCVSSCNLKSDTPEDFRDIVVCGDAFDTANRLPRRAFDLMIVDPPYNLTKSYGGEKFYKRSADEYAEFTEKWIDAFYPSLKPTASVYVCCDFMSGVVVAPILAKRFKLRNRITWQREKGRGAKNNWKNGMEDIWFCTVGDDYRFDLASVRQRRRVLAPYRENGKPKDWFTDGGEKYRDTCPSNFWDDVTVPYWSMSENTAHPTQKPEKLIAKLVLASSKKGDLLLDPFGGSGTTAAVAKKLGRHYLSIEKNPEYCAYAEARLERAETDPSIQGYEDGIFYARGAQGVRSGRKKEGENG